MSKKHDDDEYFFDDDELNSFAKELDDGKKGKSTDSDEETVVDPDRQGDDELLFDDEKSSKEEAADFLSESGSTDKSRKSSEFYDDDEEGPHEEGFMDKLKTLASKYRRVLIIVGVVVVGFIAIKLIFSPTDQEKLLASAPVKQEPVIQQSQAAPLVVQQMPSVSKQQFDAVSAVVLSNKNSLNALQSSVGSLSARQSDTDDTLNQLAAQVQQIQSQNQQLIAQVKLMQQREDDRIKKENYKKTHYVRYHIQALESGRAWLMGSDGLAITVAVGNELPHYGKILSIDVDNSTILTSSGDKIVYGNSNTDPASTR
jgi:hypothetical protein